MLIVIRLFFHITHKLLKTKIITCNSQKKFIHYSMK